MIASIFLIIGGLFYLLGGLGLYRMPDTFNRLQAGTKATTLGAFGIMLGVAFTDPSWILKAILIILLIALTNPIGSSSLAKATYLSEETPENIVLDDLKKVLKEEE